MPALIVTPSGIIMKRIISVKQAAEYCHRSIPEIKRNFPYNFIDCGSKGLGIDTADLDRWIESEKQGQGSNKAEIAMENF